MENYLEQVKNFKDFVFNFLDSNKIIYNKNIILIDLKSSCDVISEFSASKEEANNNVNSLIDMALNYRFNSNNLQNKINLIEKYWVDTYAKLFPYIDYNKLKEKMIELEPDKFIDWLNEDNKHE